MKKYKVTQEFMDSLEDWRVKFVNGEVPINALTHETHDNTVELWRLKHINDGEPMKRLGALINWFNGEDVFEVGTPKYIVQRKGTKLKHLREYIRITEYDGIEIDYFKENATRFDDFNKASEWANKHFEVVEVDE